MCCPSMSPTLLCQHHATHRVQSAPLTPCQGVALQPDSVTEQYSSAVAVGVGIHRDQPLAGLRASSPTRAFSRRSGVSPHWRNALGEAAQSVPIDFPDSCRSSRSARTHTYDQPKRNCGKQHAVSNAVRILRFSGCAFSRALQQLPQRTSASIISVVYSPLSIHEDPVFLDAPGFPALSSSRAPVHTQGD